MKKFLWSTALAIAFVAVVSLGIFFTEYTLNQPSFGYEKVSEPGIHVVVLTETERIGYWCFTYERTENGYMLFDKQGKMIVEIDRSGNTAILFQMFPTNQ